MRLHPCQVLTAVTLHSSLSHTITLAPCTVLSLIQFIQSRHCLPIYLPQSTSDLITSILSSTLPTTMYRETVWTTLSPNSAHITAATGDWSGQNVTWCGRTRANWDHSWSHTFIINVVAVSKVDHKKITLWTCLWPAVCKVLWEKPWR